MTFSLIPTTPPSLLERLHLAANVTITSLERRVMRRQRTHVLICGFPRSGTSLLFNMMAATLPGYRRDEFERYAPNRLHRLGNYITKAPMDVFHVRELDKLNINRKKLAILVVVRDVRDVLSSRHPLIPDEFFIGFDHSWWPNRTTPEGWSYSAPGIVDIFDEMFRIRERSDVMFVRYEDLVLEPGTVQAHVADRFSLPFTGSFAQYDRITTNHPYLYKGRHKARDEALALEGKPLTTTRVQRWRTDQRIRNRVRSQFERCSRLFEPLEFFSYESSRTWFDALCASSSELSETS